MFPSAGEESRWKRDESLSLRVPLPIFTSPLHRLCLFSCSRHHARDEQLQITSLTQLIVSLSSPLLSLASPLRHNGQIVPLLSSRSSTQSNYRLFLVKTHTHGHTHNSWSSMSYGSSLSRCLLLFPTNILVGAPQQLRTGGTFKYPLHMEVWVYGYTTLLLSCKREGKRAWQGWTVTDLIPMLLTAILEL